MSNNGEEGMDEELYWAVRKLGESDVDEATYNRRLRTLARKYGYEARFVAYVGSCVAGGITQKHLHLINNKEDYCPVVNNAAILF